MDSSTLTDSQVNEAVARKLGYSPFSDSLDGQVWIWKNGIQEDLPRYSEDISAAWEIVSYLDGKNETDITLETTHGWLMTINDFIRKSEVHASADTAPMAICLAFLKLP